MPFPASDIPEDALAAIGELSDTYEWETHRSYWTVRGNGHNGGEDWVMDTHHHSLDCRGIKELASKIQAANSQARA